MGFSLSGLFEQYRRALRLRSHDEPCFIGPIPYVFLFRLAFLFGVIYRGGGRIERSPWALALVAVSLALSLASVLPNLRSRLILLLFYAYTFVIVVSTFYFLSNEVTSDLFLFYFLPVFVAAEFL